MQTAPVVIQQQPCVVSAQPRTVAITVTRGLGVAQIVIGALCILFGILSVALLRYWAGSVGFGIWGGVWILIGGIIGVSSASNPTNSSLNGANMAFAIISSCIAFVQFIIYCFAVTYFREYNRVCSGWGYSYHCTSSSNSTGVAIYVILLLLMITEFAISLSVAIYCCKYGCQGCCDYTTTGVVIQQQQAHVVPSSVIVQSSGVTTSTYPAAYPVSGGMPVAYNAPVSYAPQAYSQAYTTVPPGGNPQMAYATSAGQMQVANPTAMTYGQPGGGEKQADAPPPYQ